LRAGSARLNRTRARRGQARHPDTPATTRTRYGQWVGEPHHCSLYAASATLIALALIAGTEGGNAVADVLFGKVNPGGKLPMSFPRDVGQIPISYNELLTGRPADPNNKYTSKYLDVPNTPQYLFGYGLSCTTFAAERRPRYRRAAPAPPQPVASV
jgi:beta-glucosidase